MLVTGAQGQLAGTIVKIVIKNRGVGVSREELDIAIPSGYGSRPRRSAGGHLNCAAYNQVDEAEDQPERALAINALAVLGLARAAADVDAMLVHYGTDFVFDGNATRPYTEEDAPNPKSVYASSKLIGEWFAKDAPRALVLRVESLFGGPAAKSSIDRIIGAISRGEEAKVFIDRTVSPSYVDDVARATLALLTSGAIGLFHCVNSGFCTWYELAQEIAGLMGKADGARLVGVSVADVSLRAPRPQFAALANDKLNRIVKHANMAGCAAQVSLVLV